MPRVPPNANSYFDYAVIIDFEATCEHQAPVNYQQEIIQFPAVLVDIRNGIVIDQFDSFVKPVLNPKLSSFCKELTGITQVCANFRFDLLCLSLSPQPHKHGGCEITLFSHLSWVALGLEPGDGDPSSTQER